jgi:hypothetical protein
MSAAHSMRLIFNGELIVPRARRFVNRFFEIFLQKIIKNAILGGNK